MPSAPTLLVVDDEPGMLRTVQRILGAQHRVVCARDTEEALAAAREHRPDLAILDVRLPGTDGFEVCAALRAVVLGLDVIFMTGAVGELDDEMRRSIRERAFYFIQKPFDRGLLLTLVERCLEQRRLAAENARHVARLEEELGAARRFQRSLLPGTEARFGPHHLAGRSEACSEVGGDLYDWSPVAGGEGAALLVADVSGHGVPAAMLTAVVKSAFRDALLDDFEPSSVARRVSAALAPFDEGRFVTLFACRAHAARLEYVNAGHPPAILRREGGHLEHLSLTGPMISPAFPELEREASVLSLSPGDRLVVLTDGLEEARNPDGEFLGEARLHDAIAGTGAAGCALLDALNNAVRDFCAGRPIDDDRTLATLAYD